MYRNSFVHMGGKLWNDLPEFLQHSTSIESLKLNYKCTNSSLAHAFFAFFSNWSVFVSCDHSFHSLNMPLSTWMWCFDIFSTHGLYNQECYIRGTTFTWLVLINGKLFTSLLSSFTKRFLQFQSIILSVSYRYMPYLYSCWSLCDYVYGFCCCIYQDL